MDESGPLNIDFVINNPEVIAQAKEIQATLLSVDENVQANAKAMSSAIETVMAGNVKSVATAVTKATQQVNVATDTTYQKIEKLKIQLAEFQVKASVAPNIGALASANQKIEELTANIARLGNVGKTGYDELGNAIVQNVPTVGKFEAAIGPVTDVSAIGARVVTQFSRQIIGLGVGLLSGIVGAKAIEYLVAYISNLDIFTGRLNQAKQNMIALNAVMADADKSAGKQIGSLKVLYDAATNVNNSMQTRIAAAQALREQDAATFANASAITIANGQLKKSYDELTASIIAQAKSEAALSKIQALESTVLDNQFIIDKNNGNKQATINRINAPVNFQLSGAQIRNRQQATERITNDTNKANLEPTQNIAIAERTITYLEKYATDISKATVKLDEANQLLGDKLQNFNNLIAKDTDKTDLDNIKSALQVKLDSLKPTDAEYNSVDAAYKKVEELEKKYQPKPPKTQATDPATAILASQTSLQEKIQALKTEGQTKDKTRDEQEIDAVKAKYTAIYNEIVAQNLKYTNYLKTHTAAQAAAKGLVYTDPASISADENNAIAGVTGGQQLEATKNTIAQQKVLFQAYEDFKLKAGTDAANQLYGNELKGFTNYLAYLKSLQPTEADLTSKDPATKAAASALSDYLKTAIPQAQDEELKQTQKHLQDLLASNEDYDQKRIAIISKSNDDIKVLMAAGYTDQAEQLKNATDDQLTQLQLQHFETNSVYAQLFTDLNALNAKYADERIEKGKAELLAMLQNNQITIEAYNLLIDALGKVKEANDDKKYENLEAAGQALSSIGQGFEGINTGVAGFVSALGNAFSSLGKLGVLANKFSSDLNAHLDTTKDKISLYADAIEGVESIISNIISSSAQRKKDAEDYYNSVIAFQGAYNVALDEQIKLQYQTQGDVFYTNYAAELTDAAKAYSAATSQYQKSLVDLQKGQAIVAKKNVIDGKSVIGSAGSGALAGGAIGALVGGPAAPVTAVIGAGIGAIVGGLSGLFGGKKSENVLTPLLQQYPQLIQDNGKFNESLAKTLIANNQVSDSTKVLLQNTINYYDEAQGAIDQINSALQSLAGDMGTSLENALVKAFESGTSAAQAFQGAVSDVISNIVAQFLFSDIFGSSLDKLNAALKATVLAGGSEADETAGITQDFTDFYNEAGALSNEYQQGLGAAQTAAKAQGISLFDPNSGSSGSGSSTLSGQIKGITEDQANVLEGVERGIQLLDLAMSDTLKAQGKTMTDMLNEQRSQTLLQMQIVANTKRTADNTDTMVVSLNKIDNNTSSSGLSVALRAAGIVK